MAHETRATRRAKEDEGANSKGKSSSGGGSGSLGSKSPESPGLRKSGRETSSSSSNKTVGLSPSVTRKSERIEKRNNPTSPSPPAMRKSLRIEQQSVMMTDSLRRSERGKMQSPSTSPGSKKSDKSFNSPGLEEKPRKEKSVKELTLETEQVSEIQKGVARGNKILDARAYRALFKPQPKKSERAGIEAVQQNLKTNVGLESSHSSQENGLEEETLPAKDGNGMKESFNGNRNLLSSAQTTSQRLNNVTGRAQERSQLVDPMVGKRVPEMVDPTVNDRTEAHSGVQRGCAAVPSARNVNAVNMGFDATGTVSKGNCDAADATTSSPSGDRTNNFYEICARCFKRQSINHDSEWKELCSCNKKQGPDLHVPSLAKDIITEHPPPPLDCQNHLEGSNSLVMDSCPKIGNSQEKPLKPNLNGSKLDTSRFVEYWVPVELSNVQLEQYCSTLLSKSLSLCSCSKNLVDAHREILLTTRKCCEHPYIVDRLLQGSLLKDGKVDMLDVGIKVSGKLELLDMMLFEIRKKGLRVLILFQSGGGSGKDSIALGDILDDFMRHRFGQDSYERVDGGVGLLPAKKKQAALNNFNSQKGRFVFLLETTACSPTIKLSAVDIVILFSNDWNPVFDLRNLQKIILDSQFVPIKVFRLYSSFTVEEKILILTRENKMLDNKLQNINPVTIQMLLMWGASYLFDKLVEFHSGNNLLSSGSSFQQSDLKELVIQEFSALLSQNNSDGGSSSKILQVKQNQGSYITHFQLFGELKIQLRDEELPHIFWKKLLEGREPPWRYISCSTQRNRKRVQYFEASPDRAEAVDDDVARKRRKVPSTSIDHFPHNSAHKEGNSAAVIKEGSLGGHVDAASQSLPRPSGLGDARHTNQISSSPRLVSNVSGAQVEVVKSNERANLHDTQKSLHLLLKPDISKLCEVLKLPEDVMGIVESFLEYVMSNHHVSREPATILQAFQLSLCWTAASVLKHKLDHKESLVLAKEHLGFFCKKEEADYVYSMLRCLRKTFLHHMENHEVDSQEASQLSTTYLSKVHLLPMNSLSMPSSPEKVKVEVEDLTCCEESSNNQILSQLDLAKKDVSQSIKGVEKKCSKQMTKLLQKQQEEREELKRKCEAEKALLWNKKKTEAAVIRLHSSGPMRTDKLMLLDTEYEKKFEQLKYQMETDLKNLEALHQDARNKLQKRKIQWVDGLKSWAQVELLNRPPFDEAGHNQESAVPLNSFSQKKIPEGSKSQPDGGVSVQVTETISSDDDEVEILPGISSASKQIQHGATSGMVGEGLPSEAPNTVNLRGGSENGASVILPSSEDQVANVMVAAKMPEADTSNDNVEKTINEPHGEEQFHDAAPVMVAIRELPVGVTEIVSSSARLENAVSVNPSPSGKKDCDGAPLHMHGRVVLSGNSVTSPQPVDDGNTVGDNDTVGNSTASDGVTGLERQFETVSISNQRADHPDNDTSVSQQNVENSSGLLETTVEVSKGGTCNEQHQKEVQSSNQDSYSLSSGLNQQNDSVPSGVPHNHVSNPNSESDKAVGVNLLNQAVPSEVTEPACCEVRKSGNCGALIDDVCIAVSNDSTLVIQQTRVDSTTNQQDHSYEPPVVNSPSAQPVNTLPLGSPVSSTQALQDDLSLPTTPTILQDRVAPANGSENALQQVQASSSHPDDDLALSQPDNVSLCTDFPILESLNLPSASRSEDQPSREGHIMPNCAQSTPPVENHLNVSNQAVLQPPRYVGLQLPSEIPAGGSGMHVSDPRAVYTTSGISNRPIQSAPSWRMPLPSSHDPLQTELERIRKEIEQTVNLHEETKQRLKSECEKELEEVAAQIRRKYEMKLLELEPGFVQKKKELDGFYNKVYLNKILAEAFRSKCMDIRASNSPATQQDMISGFMQQLLHLSSQPAAQRPSIVNGLSIAGCAAGRAQNIASPGPTAPPAASLRTATEPPQSLHPTSVAFSGRPPRQSHISSIPPATGNLQIGSEIRARAPHLQSCRPVASLPASSIPLLSRTMQNQQLASVPPAVSQVQSQLPLSAHQPSPTIRIPQPEPETSTVGPSLTSSTPSGLELLMNVEHQRIGNAFQPSSSAPLTGVVSNSNPLVPSVNTVRPDQPCLADVVCLSDDD